MGEIQNPRYERFAQELAAGNTADGGRLNKAERAYDRRMARDSKIRADFHSRIPQAYRLKDTALEAGFSGAADEQPGYRPQSLGRVSDFLRPLVSRIGGA
jgi:hypothetical protein